LLVKAPSLKAGSVKRLVVAIGTTRPVSSRAALKSRTIWSRSRPGGVGGHQVVVVEVDAVGAHLGQQVDDLHGREAARGTGSPKGSRPGLPTVQRPKVNLF
jgi:hypothetical protein